MPGWLIAVLKWGGLALAAVNAIALVYVVVAGVPPALGEASPEAQDAPWTAYVYLIVVGTCAALLGFVMDRRRRA